MMATRTWRVVGLAVSAASRAPGMEIMDGSQSSSKGCGEDRGRWPRSVGTEFVASGRGVASDHPRAELRKLLRHQWRAGVMRLDAAVLRGETKCHRHVEFRERRHL